MKTRVSAIKLRAAWRSDAFAIVHQSCGLSDPPWRVSFFDDDGPVGHTFRDTRSEAVKVAVSDGYALLESIR